MLLYILLHADTPLHTTVNTFSSKTFGASERWPPDITGSSSSLFFLLNKMSSRVQWGKIKETHKVVYISRARQTDKMKQFVGNLTTLISNMTQLTPMAQLGVRENWNPPAKLIGKKQKENNGQQENSSLDFKPFGRHSLRHKSWPRTWRNVT